MKVIKCSVARVHVLNNRFQGMGILKTNRSSVFFKKLKTQFFFRTKSLNTSLSLKLVDQDKVFQDIAFFRFLSSSTQVPIFYCFMKAKNTNKTRFFDLTVSSNLSWQTSLDPSNFLELTCYTIF